MPRHQWYRADNDKAAGLWFLGNVYWENWKRSKVYYIKIIVNLCKSSAHSSVKVPEESAKLLMEVKDGAIQAFNGEPVMSPANNEMYETVKWPIQRETKLAFYLPDLSWSDFSGSPQRKTNLLHIQI